jgi:hypothetical protein
MNQGGINISGSLVAHSNASEILNPRVGSFNNPTPSIFPQLPSVLMRGPSVILSRRNDGLNVQACQIRPGFVAVIPSIGDQLIRVSSFPVNSYRLQRRQKQFHFRRGRRVHVKSDRSTPAINQYHKLRSLPAFCFTHFEPPFLAEANVPSTKHSFQRICFLSSSCARNDLQSFSNTPSRVHFCSRRWTVLGRPYRSGNSLHGDPVQRIQRIPSIHFRSSTGLRPARFRLTQGRLGIGNSALTFSHCASVNFLHAIRLAPPVGVSDSRHESDYLNYFSFIGNISG